MAEGGADSDAELDQTDGYSEDNEEVLALTLCVF